MSPDTKVWRFYRPIRPLTYGSISWRVNRVGCETAAMSLTMTRTEREEFLAGVHVGVLGVTEPDGGALAVPIWYGYEPGGDIWIITGKTSRKAKGLEVEDSSACARRPKRSRTST